MSLLHQAIAYAEAGLVAALVFAIVVLLAVAVVMYVLVRIARR